MNIRRNAKYNNRMKSTYSNRWAVIVGRPGLGALFPVRLSRVFSARKLEQQFGKSVIFCPRVLDGIIRNEVRNVRVDEHQHKFLLFFISQYLEIVEQPVFHSEQSNFVESCVVQYCGRIAEEHYYATNFPVNKKEELVCIALSKWMEMRNKRTLSEDHLNLNLAEDLQRSVADMKSVLKRSIDL
mmetsp:Transcript_1848/g.2847  ORF Transcript_1848/g.2847 Transcript_1848/m.2847 type:complete len:184 (+) Transcript_1848:86-637(+)